MAERVQVQPRRQDDKTEQVEDPSPEATTTASVEDIDDLLDDIDTVLEENAWVDQYVQKGGE